MGTERDRLVEEHLSVVRSIAGQIARGLPSQVQMDDLVSAGTRGLIEAADRFDPARGVGFVTFAYYRIRGAIFDDIRRMTWLPRRTWHKSRFSEKVDEVAETAAPEGVPPAGEEAARAVGTALSEIAVAYVATVESFDRTPAAGESPEGAAEASESRGQVRAAISALPEKERTLLELHYFEDLTLQEAGERLGLSKSWASRLHTRALRLLREQLAERSGR